MALDLANPTNVTALIVFLVEIVLITILIFARINARRLKIDTHHKYVYSVVLVNTTIILTWMLPRELNIINLILQGRINAIAVWYLLFHALFGSVAITLGIFLCLVFLMKVLRKDLVPLTLLRKMKPIMITTFIFWSLAFFFGCMVFVNRYIIKFL